MIKQQFFINDSEIFRLYHNGFEDYPINRNIEHSESITGGKVKFRESWIENIEDEVINHDNLAHGFLPINHSKNPYSTLCCEYQEFITYQKDFIKDGKVINLKQFNEICDFVKKWCGFNLRESPFSINNILIFTPTNINIKPKLDKEKGRILKLLIPFNEYGGLICVAKFKLNRKIVDTRIIQVTNQEISIKCRREWSVVDIELFSNEQLVYAYYDLSFIESINIDMGLTTKKIEMKLQHADKTVTLENVVSDHITIGKSVLSNELISYEYQEQLIKKHLNPTRRFDFLTKGQYERGLEIFEEIAKGNDYTEMWVFDPYFVTYDTLGGKARLNDIISILGKNLRLKKNIVFEIKEKDADPVFNNFKKAIQPTVDYLKKRNVPLKFSFLGTKEHFHDRFIFLKNDYRLKTFMLGTSFNSFGDNYSTIIELDPLNGSEVFEILLNDIANPNSLLISEDLT